MMCEKNSHKSRAVTEVSKYNSETGEYIKTYESINSIKSEHPTVNHGNIIRACKTRSKSLGFL